MSAKTNTIDQPTAVAWTTAYRGRVPTGSVRAFLIPVSDLLQVASEVIEKGDQGNPMVRAYLAYDASKNEDKLVIVGTNEDDSTLPSTYYDMLPSANPTYSIWDFTLPCPTYCDDNSPLNQ